MGGGGEGGGREGGRQTGLGKDNDVVSVSLSPDPPTG